MSELDIQVQACRTRQQRVLKFMEQRQIDLVLLTTIEHIQYLCGPRFDWKFSPVAALDALGQVTLVAPALAMPAVHAADDLRSYDAQWHCTLRNDQRSASSQVLLDALAGKPKPKRLGIEFHNCGPDLTTPLGGDLVAIDASLYELRRRKDADELARIRKAIAATGAMYRQAREMIRPGINELDVFNELQSAAVRACGEMITGTGNDYACGAPGGPPRDRKIEAGELYVLDLGPAYRGYFADNCRAIAVSGSPTDEQQRLWERIVPALMHVEKTVRPGKSCRELYLEVEEILGDADGAKLSHHLGHGIGLYPHEAPHLNPFWDDTFQEGEVFTAEPGLYAPKFRGGIRLENDYLVTQNGVELLSDFPLELHSILPPPNSILQ
jgi:Xaa-Pro aminopeptidase